MTDTDKAAAPAAADGTAMSADTSADVENLANAPAVQEEDEDAVWASIQAEKKGLEEPVASESPVEAEPAEKPAQAEPAPEPVDIWANATPEQKAAYEAATAERAKNYERFRSSAARASALQKKLNAAAQEGRRDERPAREELAGISQDYPEIAQPLEKALERIDGRLEHLAKARQSEIETDQAELVGIVEAETKTLAAKHPDYVTVLQQNGPAFQAWVEDQPARLREAAYRNGQMIVNADEAAQVIDGFKRFITGGAPRAAPEPPQSLDSKRQRQLASMSSPQRSGSSRPTVSGIPEEGDEEAIWAAIQAEKRRKNA